MQDDTTTSCFVPSAAEHDAINPGLDPDARHRFYVKDTTISAQEAGSRKQEVGSLFVRSGKLPTPAWKRIMYRRSRGESHWWEKRPEDHSMA